MDFYFERKLEVGEIFPPEGTKERKKIEAVYGQVNGSVEKVLEIANTSFVYSGGRTHFVHKENVDDEDGVVRYYGILLNHFAEPENQEQESNRKKSTMLHVCMRRFPSSADENLCRGWCPEKIDSSSVKVEKIWDDFFKISSIGEEYYLAMITVLNSGA